MLIAEISVHSTKEAYEVPDGEYTQMECAAESIHLPVPIRMSFFLIADYLLPGCEECCCSFSAILTAWKTLAKDDNEYISHKLATDPTCIISQIRGVGGNMRRQFRPKLRSQNSLQ